MDNGVSETTGYKAQGNTRTHTSAQWTLSAIANGNFFAHAMGRDKHDRLWTPLSAALRPWKPSYLRGCPQYQPQHQPLKCDHHELQCVMQLLWALHTKSGHSCGNARSLHDRAPDKLRNRVFLILGVCSRGEVMKQAFLSENFVEKGKHCPGMHLPKTRLPWLCLGLEMMLSKMLLMYCSNRHAF